MATPPQRGQQQQGEDDKPVMKVTVVSCKGERPSESVINVHIDGINPNANSPQIDKFMRRLTKNVVKIQNEIENQKNPNRKQKDSANGSPANSNFQDMKTTQLKGKSNLTTTNTAERETSKLPACRHQNTGTPIKEILQHNLYKEINPLVNISVPAKCTTSNTDIVEIYSNKLKKQSCDSVMNEWVSNDSSGENLDPTLQPIRRKRSLSCNNIPDQRVQNVQVYQVNFPGTSRGKYDDVVGQEDTETDDISISTVSFGNKSTCSCCHHHLGAQDGRHADGMPFGELSSSTVVLSGKSSNSSAFNCCAAPGKRRTTTTTSTSPGRSSKNKKSSDGASTLTDTSRDSNTKGGKGKTGNEKQRDSLTEKEILEKQMALLSEKARNEELSKQTEEKNKMISELNKKLDELFRTNAELSRVNAEEQRRKEEEKWRMEDERQRELERQQAEEAKRLEKNYPGDGSNRRVRTMTKGNRTNIEAIEELLHKKLPKPAIRDVAQGPGRWGEYPANAYRDSWPQRNQCLNGPAMRGMGGNEDRRPPREDFIRARAAGYSAYDPRSDFPDRPRGPGDLEAQDRSYDYDPSRNFFDRSRGPGNFEAQGRRQEYDPNSNFSYGIRCPGKFDTEGRRQEFYPNYDVPMDSGYPANIRGPPQTPIPMQACERCGGSDQDVTFCCCFKKSTKPKAKSRPASPQRLCKCCGQCPTRCICEKGDLAPIALYQNAASLPDIPAQIGDAVYPLRDIKSTEKAPFESESKKSSEIISPIAINNAKQMGDGQPSTSTECLDKGNRSGHLANGISRTGLDKSLSKISSVVDEAVLQKNSFKSVGKEGEQTSPDIKVQPNVDPQFDKEKKELFVEKMLGCECDDKEGEKTSPDLKVQPSADPQFDKEKKGLYVQKMLGCECAHTAQIGDGINPSQEGQSRETISAAGQIDDISAASINSVKKSVPVKSKNRRNVFKFLCSCCNCTDSQESMVNGNGVLQSISRECLDEPKSVASQGNGLSRTSLAKSSSKASSVGEKPSRESIGQGEGQSSPDGAQLSVDPQFDKEKKEKFIQHKLGCDCEGQDDTQTVYEKFTDDTKKGQLIKKMMTCDCEDPIIQDFPSEELISFENYDEQYFDDIKGIDVDHHRGYNVNQKGEGGMQHSCGINSQRDTDRKQNLVERRLDRHGFGQRRDCDKKRALVQTRMGCVCNAEETGETLKKQRILEDRLGCSCRPLGDPRKMGEYVRNSLGCGTQCDEHMVREARRKQAIVERHLHCSANRLRDTDKKSAYLKRRLDCICDDAGTQAKKQQAYLERFLTCGCTNVAKDMKKKKQFVDDFLKCKCDKESEVKKMQLYLERSLSCDCEHIKERNMDKKIDYMNKVMSCDGPSCKAEKEGKELVTVCGDGKASVADVTKRLPPNPSALGSSSLSNDALLCSCGSGVSYLGPCRCDSMSDAERSSVRRQRRGVISSVTGGLICRCGKEGDSECICDGVKERPAKPSVKRSKAKCVCRDRLDGICRCRGKAGRNMGSGGHRPYMVDQVPCQSAIRPTAKSVSDSIFCSAKKGNCNCEQDPESCFCSKDSTVKSDAEQEKASVTEQEKTISDSAEEKSVEEEEDDTASSPEENQVAVDQIEEPPKVAPIVETKAEDGCICKKNCSGKCKCDIDGSDCSHGKQARRCYCDAEGPETCICAKTASPQLTTHVQGKCRCTKDGAGRCKCDLRDGGQQRSGNKIETSGTCHCHKDASGLCKCDKVENTQKTTKSLGHSGVVIELKNIHSKPEVSITGMEPRKGNLKVTSSSSGDDGKDPENEQHAKEHETQVYHVESHHSGLFVLKEPHFEEFSSESCPESIDELVNDSAFESPLSSSTSGNEFESPLNTSASDHELKVSPNTSSSCNTIQTPPSALGSDFECLQSKSASSKECQDPHKEQTISTISRRDNFEIPQESQTREESKESASSLVESLGTQSGPSLAERKTGETITEGQVKPPDTEAVTSAQSASAGPTTVLGEGRRPKWYHMFHISKSKSHKRRKRESEDSTGHSTDVEDC